MMATCKIADCDKPAATRGWCPAHYQRWRQGRPLHTPVGVYRSIKTLDDLLASCVPEGDCLVWTRGTTSIGYGSIRRNNKHVLAHRLAWELANGRPVPEGLYVLHSCHNPPCCNPDHLRVGTQADNMRDAAEAGRTSPPPVRRGADNPAARLADDDVREIRRLHAGGMPLARIAPKYGVSGAAISKIVRREMWAHVD